MSLTPDQMVKMTEVKSALKKSQKDAQEMSNSVTKLTEDIKQLRASRTREETVIAKEACVGGAQTKLALNHMLYERAEIKSLLEVIKCK